MYCMLGNNMRTSNFLKQTLFLKRTIYRGAATVTNILVTAGHTLTLWYHLQNLPSSNLCSSLHVPCSLLCSGEVSSSRYRKVVTNSFPVQWKNQGGIVTHIVTLQKHKKMCTCNSRQNIVCQIIFGNGVVTKD